MKQLRYAIEAIFVYSVYGIFWVLPVDTASALGGCLLRSIGPLLPVSKRARLNLERALPGKTDAEYNAIIRGMWDNLGRILAEYPHLPKFLANKERLQFTDTNYLPTTSPKIVIGGHLGNWELSQIALYSLNNPFIAIYRKPNNPWVEKLLEFSRNRVYHGAKNIAKSRRGTRAMVQHLKDGDDIGILIDQKYNEGVEASFLGMPAMTSPAFIQLGQKFNIPVIPGRTTRLNGANFRVTFYPALQLFEKDGKTARPVEDVMYDAHQYLEQWIKDTPEQWLWLHNRWKTTDKPKAE